MGSALQSDAGTKESLDAAKGPDAGGKERGLFPQTRALEIAPPLSFDGAEAERLAWQVAQAGFNTILLRCFSRGQTVFPSPTMRAHGFAAQDRRYRGADPAVAMLDAARRKGLAVYALVEALYVGGDKGRSPILRHRSEWGVRGRDPLGRETHPHFLCPVNRDVRRFLGDLCHEIMEGYGFEGLYLRHLHFPVEQLDDPAEYCLCDYCRREVWRSLGVKVDKIPDDPDHPDRYNLTAWRAKQLAGLLSYLQLRAAKACVRPLTVVEACLAPNGETRAERCGYQDGSAWAMDKLVPIVALRPLPEASDESGEWLDEVARVAQCSMAMPVLSASPNGQLVERLEQLATEPIAGVVVPEPHDLTAPPLNQLAKGPWREPAQVAERRPLLSVCALLAATTELLSPNDTVRAFLADALRVVEPLGEDWPASQRETIYANLLGLEERIADEKVDLGDAAPVVSRNFRLARHLLRMMDIES